MNPQLFRDYKTIKPEEVEIYVTQQLPNHLPKDGFIHSIRENGSNINPKFENVTQTQQFKRWFGNSLVVNKDGTPKIVYHSTDSDFTVFDITKSRSYDETVDYDLPGFYFSESNLYRIVRK